MWFILRSEMVACVDAVKKPTETRMRRLLSPRTDARLESHLVISLTIHSKNMAATNVLRVSYARAKFAACAKKFSRWKKFQKLE